jgi:hypothetical protein
MEEKKTGKADRFAEDFPVGLAVIAFGISILAQVPGSYGDVMLFPKIAAIVCLACGAFIIGTGFWRPSGRPRQGFRNELICIAISAFMFVMMTLSGQLGFFACLFIICFAVNQLIALFCREGGMKSLVRSLLASIVMCGLTFAIFRLLLGILTPEGLLI